MKLQNETDANSIGEYLRWKRGKRTQSDVAAEAGVSVTLLSRWEQPGSFPTWTSLRKIGSVLGLTIEDWRNIGELGGAS